MAARDEVDRPSQRRVALVVGTRHIALGLQRDHLGLAHPEEEEVVIADEAPDLDVGAVVGADGQRPVEGELHVAGAGGLLAGQGDLLGQVGRRDDLLGEGDVVVGREADDQLPLDQRVIVDDGGHPVDEIDDLLGHEVARSRLGAEHDEAGRDVLRTHGPRQDALVRRDDVQHLEQLPLVFVQPLDHDVDEVPFRQADTLERLGQRVEPLLVGGLRATELGTESRVIGIRLQLTQPLEVGDPPLSDGVGDHLRESRIGHSDEATRGDAVRDVGELLRPERREVRQHLVTQQLGVQFGDAVDADRRDRREVCHPHRLRVVGDDRHPPRAHLVARVCRAHTREELLVDPVDDLQMPGEQPPEQIGRPHLERLGQQRVARVGEALLGDRPGLVPLHALLVDEQAHELGDGDDRVGVVELEDDLLGEFAQVEALGQGPVEVVPQRTGDEKVLLLQAQLPPLGSRVLRVEHLGDVLGEGLGAHGLGVVAGVEDREVERPGRLGAPQPQGVDDAVAVAGNHVVVRDSQHIPGWHPLAAGHARLIDDVLDPATEVDAHGPLGVGELPWRPEGQPVVRDLGLASVDKGLPEDPVLVADPVTDAADVHRGQRVDEARCETAQSAVAQPRLDLLDAHLAQVQSTSLHRLVDDVAQIGGHECVPELPPEQVFRGQIADHLGRVLTAPLGGLQPGRHEVVAHSSGQREVLVVDRGTRQCCALAEVQLTQVVLHESVDGAFGCHCRAEGQRMRRREGRPDVAKVNRR